MTRSPDKPTAGEPEPIFKEWVVLELMGHLKRIGLATEAELFGGKLLRIDVLGQDGKITGTQYYGANAIYCMTTITEGRAKEMAQPYRAPRLPLKAASEEDPDFDEVEEDDGESDYDMDRYSQR